MIHVVATIDVVEGKRSEFLSAFHRLMPLVHAEQGCVAYVPTVDVSTEITKVPPRHDVVVVVEKWESLEALKSHLNAAHMADFRQANGQLIKAISIQVTEQA
ncbi:MAG: putative quinol monooxygenase [Planctomycetota bacterium]|nr:putative quinol monooxygenase [Planctomycetota bacterium]MDA1179912.1 putative quinol monooxygenase [Planctomycetota bacterium]